MRIGKCPHCKTEMMMTAMKQANEPLLGVCLKCGYERPCNNKVWDNTWTKQEMNEYVKKLNEEENNG